jgi:hypothetical protein
MNEGSASPATSRVWTPGTMSSNSDNVARRACYVPRATSRWPTLAAGSGTRPRAELTPTGSMAGSDGAWRFVGNAPVGEDIVIHP